MSDSCDACGSSVEDALARTVRLSVDRSTVDEQRLCPGCFADWIDRYEAEMQSEPDVTIDEENDIIVDVAHVNTPGVLDVCEITKKPLFCTHTGVKGVHEHARNLTDEEIDGIKESDGVIGIMFAPVFLAGSARADHSCVLDHIDYVVDRVGVRHVGIGSDFDGWIPIPSDMRDCRDISLIRSGLEDRGYNAPDIARIMGVNALELLAGDRGS